MVPRLGTEFLPELDEGSIWINVPLHPSLSVTESRRELSKIRGAIAHIPEIKTIVYKAGRPEDGTDPKPLNMGEFFVDLKPQKEWKRGLTKEKVIEEMDRNLDALPGVESSFSQPIRDNVMESISQIKGQIVIKVAGDDLAELRRLWSDPATRAQLLAGLAEKGYDRGTLGEIQRAVDADGSDLFDVLALLGRDESLGRIEDQMAKPAA